MLVTPQSVFLLEETRLKLSEQAEDAIIQALRNRKFTGQLTLDFSQGTAGFATIKQAKAGRRAAEENESRIWTPRPIAQSVGP